MAAYFGDTLPRTLKTAPYGVVFFVCLLTSGIYYHAAALGETPPILGECVQFWAGLPMGFP